MLQGIRMKVERAIGVGDVDVTGYLVQLGGIAGQVALPELDGGSFPYEFIWDTTSGIWCGEQVDPVGTDNQTTVNTFHIEQGANQSALYRITQELDFVNWNEYLAPTYCMTNFAGAPIPIP